MAELGLVTPDLAGLDSLIVESEADGFDFLRRIPGLVTADSGYLDSARSFVLGAYDAGRLIGIGGVTPDPYLVEDRLGRVRHVYIARSHRRTGVGRLLMNGLEFRAAAAYTRLRLRAVTSDAAAFYESLGYQPISADRATHIKSLPERPMFTRIMPEIPFSDVAAGVAYYRDVLGFSINYQQGDIGVMDRDAVRVLLVARTPRHSGAASACVYVRDADGLHSELRARGAALSGGPVSHPWGLRDFHVIDPEGNRITFAQALW